MKTALLHVALSCSLCVAIATSGFFDSVLVDLGYEHYAERPVSLLPACLAMPFNSLVNLGYVLLGVYWLRRGTENAGRGAYFKDVFALMALVYGPIQWLRIATQARRLAVLDQWFTLPIFAWVPIWCHYIAGGWSPRHVLVVEAASLCSYGLALSHDLGFELALGCHVALAVTQGLRIQRRFGDSQSLACLAGAVLSCVGFVVLKLLDHRLAEQLWIFRHLSGHFCSKVCDVLQFHFSFLFLWRLT
ncbi:TM187 protein, partial [Polyodon spathula]|nr:TM187 protein [Polyodon spathula]